jgi:hypothetical protein
MKKVQNIRFIYLWLPCLLLISVTAAAQDKDSVVSKEVVKLRYFNEHNSMQYILLESTIKTGKKVTPQINKVFQLYLDSNKAENLVAKVYTGKDGKAKAFIPPALKTLWEASPKHIFIAVAEATSKEEETAYEFEMAKARLTLDTSSEEGAKSITVLAEQLVDGEWVPAPDVEMKVGVQRLGGILSAGEEETYTTDSSGSVTVEVKRDSLPGDQKGNVVLAARVDDNDMYGSLLATKTVPWGVAVKPDTGFFDQRTLWSTRFRTPLWLLMMAYAIVIGVWGTIIYLVMQIVKIKKLGKEVPV